MALARKSVLVIGYSLVVLAVVALFTDYFPVSHFSGAGDDMNSFVKVVAGDGTIRTKVATFMHANWWLLLALGLSALFIAKHRMGGND